MPPKRSSQAWRSAKIARLKISPANLRKRTLATHRVPAARLPAVETGMMLLQYDRC